MGTGLAGPGRRGEAHVTRVGELVLATAAHSASADDPAAWALLDADLAILGADPEAYGCRTATLASTRAHAVAGGWRGPRCPRIPGFD